MGNLSRAIWVGRIILICFAGLVASDLNYHFSIPELISWKSILSTVAFISFALAFLRPFGLSSQLILWIVMLAYGIGGSSSEPSLVFLLLMLYSSYILLPIYYHKMLSLTKWHEATRINTLLAASIWIVALNTGRTSFWITPIFWTELAFLAGLALTLKAEWRRTGMLISGLVLLAFLVDSVLERSFYPNIYGYAALYGSTLLLRAYNPHRAGIFRFRIQQGAIVIALLYLVVAKAPNEYKTLWADKFGVHLFSDSDNRPE